MKVLYSAVLIGLLMGTLFTCPVKATSPTTIAGTVKDGDTGEPLEAELCFKNLVTQEIEYLNSDEDGSYVFDLYLFDDGWNYGNTIEVSTVLLDYTPYVTEKYLHQDWPDTVYTLDLKLFPRIPDQEVTNPWGPDPGNVDLIGQEQVKGTAQAHWATINWDQDTGFNIKVPLHNPAYDGVEVIAYFQVDDNGQWVPVGQSLWVKSIYSMKIEYDVIPRTTALYFSGNFTYVYPISRNAPHTYDPPMDAKLAYGDINCRDLLFTCTINGTVYTDQACTNIVQGRSFNASEYHTGRYFWEV
jgi:hypothetical protein